MTCGTDQVLDGAVPTCTRASCNTLEEQANQVVTCDKQSAPYLYEDTCDVGCAAGYMSNDGRQIWTCTDTNAGMSFSGTAVSCQKEKCKYGLLNLDSKKFTHNCISLSASQKCAVSCNSNNYEQTGDAIEYTCGSDLVLKGDGLPHCTLRTLTTLPSSTLAAEITTSMMAAESTTSMMAAESTTLMMAAENTTLKTGATEQPESSEAASVNRVNIFVACVFVALVIAALGDS